LDTLPKLNPLGTLGDDADLIAKQRAARLRPVSPPDTLSADLHGIDYGLGEEVIDSVTGSVGVILGWGIEQVPGEQ
jgi:hypothetical protein